MGLKKISWLLVPIVLFAAVCVLFRAVLFVGVVPSASMEPTIPAGSVLLGCRVVGDNRENSLDSPVWQKPFVDKENVIAVLLGSMGGSKQQFS